MAAKFVKSSLPTICPYCEVNGKEVNVHFDNEGIGICPVCQNAIDANPTERATMFDPMSSKTAWSGSAHATDIRSNDNRTAGYSGPYENRGFHKVKGPADVPKRDEVSKPTVDEGYVRRIINMLSSVPGYRSTQSPVTPVVLRTVIFRVYIPLDIERQRLCAASASLLCVLLNPLSLHQKPIAWLTRRSGSQHWEGVYMVQGHSSTSIEYCYCIYDNANNQMSRECGLKGGQRTERISLTEGHAITLYDGTAAFRQSADDKTQLGKLYEEDIINGFKAMQPNWLEELRTEERHKARFGDLLTWVDRISNTKRPFQFVQCDASLVDKSLKDWVKQDIKRHLKLLKEDEQTVLNPEQLFLSMTGLIYRANSSLDVSEKEIIEKLNKLIGRTMESIGDNIKNWKAWMDRSIETLRESSLVTCLEKVTSKMVEDFPEGNWPYLLPLQHYMRGYLVGNVEEKKLLQLAFPDKIKPIKKQKEPSNWNDRLEPFMADDPLLSYSVMQLMNDALFQQFLVAYSEGKTKGNRLGAVLLRAKDLLENQDFVAKEYTYGVMQKFLIRGKDWETSQELFEHEDSTWLSSPRLPGYRISRATDWKEKGETFGSKNKSPPNSGPSLSSCTATMKPCTIAQTSSCTATKKPCTMAQTSSCSAPSPPSSTQTEGTNDNPPEFEYMEKCEEAFADTFDVTPPAVLESSQSSEAAPPRPRQRRLMNQLKIQDDKQEHQRLRQKQHQQRMAEPQEARAETQQFRRDFLNVFKDIANHLKG